MQVKDSVFVLIESFLDSDNVLAVYSTYELAEAAAYKVKKRIGTVSPGLPVIEEVPLDPSTPAKYPYTDVDYADGAAR